MSDVVKLQLLSDGRIRFNRGTKEYNQNMLQILSAIIKDVETKKKIEDFFRGSEEVELLIGSEILCG